MKEVTMADAPVWYKNAEASAWADGYNAAVEKMAAAQEDLYDKITETTTTVWEGRVKRDASKTDIKTNSKMTADKEEIEKSEKVKEDSDEMIRAKNIVQKAVISLEAIFEELSELENSK